METMTMKIDILIFIVGGLMVMCLCVIVFSFIPPHIRCRWGFHEWMNPNYPWWGGCEQSTYCCDLTMKVERKKRVAFTEDDISRKKKRLKEAKTGRRRYAFEKKLRQDMKSDDYCEELLP